MLGSRTLFTLFSGAAALMTASAYTGRGSTLTLPSSTGHFIDISITATWDSLGTTPCPVQCPLTDYRVALPVDMFPNGEKCCSTVHVSCGYTQTSDNDSLLTPAALTKDQGTNIDVTFTDLFLAGQGSFNISLSHQAFAELAALELGQIYPVTWNL